MIDLETHARYWGTIFGMIAAFVAGGLFTGGIIWFIWSLTK